MGWKDENVRLLGASDRHFGFHRIVLDLRGNRAAMTGTPTSGRGVGSGRSLTTCVRRAGRCALGSPTTGMIEYGNIVPYVLPESGLVIDLPTKHNDYGFPVESVGFPVDESLGADVSAEEVASEFESFV